MARTMTESQISFTRTMKSTMARPRISFTRTVKSTMARPQISFTRTKKSTKPRPQISFTRTTKYCDYVAEKLNQIIDDQDFTDFTLTVKGEALRCHKLTLAVHSPVIHAMLKSGMSDVAKQSFSLDDIPLEIVRKILKFMYVGKISIDPEEYIDLLKASDYLQMDVLTEMCINGVSSILKPDNVISWLEVATSLCLPNITSMCTKIIFSNLAEVSRQPEFLALESTEVQYYFTEVMKVHGINHDIVLYLTMSWANHDPKNRLADLENFLHVVQLSSRVPGAILKPNNIMLWLKVATTLDLPNIISMCTKIISSKIVEVSQQLEFLFLKSIEVQKYFSGVIKVHDIDHDSVLYLTMSWANHDPKKRLADLENLLRIFQLTSCSHDAVLKPNNVISWLKVATKQDLADITSMCTSSQTLRRSRTNQNS